MSEFDPNAPVEIPVSEAPAPAGRWVSGSPEKEAFDPAAPVEIPDDVRPPSVGYDVARSVAAQGAKGVLADIPGFIGSSGQLADLAMAKLAKYMVLKPLKWAGVNVPEDEDQFVKGVRGLGQSPAEQRGDVNKIFGVPFITQQGAERLANGMLPGLDYEPQTTAGKYAGSAARMATSSLVLGPGGSLPAKAAMGAISGLTSEAAGQAASAVSPDWEPYARFLGALIGPAAAWKVVSGAKHFVSPELAAHDEVAAALATDLRRGTERMTPQQIQDAVANGAAPSVVDMGGDALRALVRKKGFAGPQAEEEFARANEMLAARQATAGARVADKIATDYSLTTDAAQKQAQVEALNRPDIDRVYQIARADPKAQTVWSPVLEQLAASDTIKTAMAKAKSVSTDPGSEIRAYAPATQNAPGQFPNLSYWDQVKRSLDDRMSTAAQAGEKDEAARLLKLKKQLVAELDQQVPSYKTARDTASEAFGQANALEAGFYAAKNGDAFATKDVLDNFAKFNPGQQGLFRQGTADYLRGVAAESGPAGVVKIMQKPQNQARLSAVLGQAAYDSLLGHAISEQLTSAARPLQAAEHASQFQDAARSAGMGAAAGAALDLLHSSAMGYAPSPTALAWGVGSATLTAAAKAALNAQEQRVAPFILRAVGSQDPAELARLAALARANPNARSAIEKLTREMTETAIRNYQTNPPNAAEAAPLDDRPHRASGGRAAVNHGERAEALIRAAERARKQEGQETKPLLGLPDATIARALDAANRSAA